MSSSQSNTLVPFDQAELDRRYWSTDDKVADIAGCFGVSPGQVCKLATPYESGLRCLLCDGSVVAHSRSRLGEEWLACRSCGAARRQRENPYENDTRRYKAARAEEKLNAGPRSMITSHVLVRRRIGETRWEIGRGAQQAIDRLESIGRPWDATHPVHVLEPYDGIDEIDDLLSGEAPGIVGVDRLSTLGDSQTEALQALYLLTRSGWRVVSSRDSEVRSIVGFTEMNRLSNGDRWTRDPEWDDDGPMRWDDLAFGDKVINATARFGRGW